MADDNKLSDLKAQMAALVDAAYAQGVSDTLGRIIDAARSGNPVHAAPGTPLNVDRYVVPHHSDTPGKRAPKGSLDPILDEVLTERPGLSTGQVEQEVLKRDSRIALKSIYNRLRHCEKTDQKYYRQNGNWYRKPDPNEVFSPPSPHFVRRSDDDLAFD